MSYTNGLDNPELYFQTKLYTGNSGTNAITLDGSENMQPDWIWIKERGATGSHVLTDVVRGITKQLYSNDTQSENTNSSSITAIGSDGFTLGNRADVNNNSDTYVAWNWKAGTSFTNDASATGIGTIDSTGSVSTTAGFSIISFTGQTGTVAHGLGVKPSMIILKCRAIANNFVIQHKGLTGGMDEKALIFTTSAEISAATAEPTTSVFTVNNQIAENNDNIAYIFSDIKGYSKFGKYTGNGNADGTFIYTGFKPSFVLQTKTSGTSDWVIYDNKRDPSNIVKQELKPNSSGAESSFTNIDILSNGFKQRANYAYTNNSGGTYIYLAFAESPFVNSNGVPNNAR